LPEVFGEPVGDVHRAMLAAGAADGDGQIAAVRLGEFENALLEKLRERTDHSVHGRLRGEKVDHLGIAAGEVA